MSGQLVRPRFLHDRGEAPYVRVYASAVQSTADTVVTFINCNTEQEDRWGFHDTVTNNTRLTVPVGFAGVYMMGFAGYFAASNLVGQRVGGIRVNATTDLISEEGFPSATDLTFVAGTTIYRLADGDYIEHWARQLSGIAVNYRLDSVRTFWMTRLGD